MRAFHSIYIIVCLFSTIFCFCGNALCAVHMDIVLSLLSLTEIKFTVNTHFTTLLSAFAYKKLITSIIILAPRITFARYFEYLFQFRKYFFSTLSSFSHTSAPAAFAPHSTEHTTHTHYYTLHRLSYSNSNSTLYDEGRREELASWRLEKEKQLKNVSCRRQSRMSRIQNHDITNHSGWISIRRVSRSRPSRPCHSCRFFPNPTIIPLLPLLPRGPSSNHQAEREKAKKACLVYFDFALDTCVSHFRVRWKGN
jgi:hypothetical protein